jgi:hypothetical protein
VLYDGPDHGNNGPMGSGCDASDRVVRKVEGMMGTTLESAGSVRTWSHEVRKTREYLPSDGPLPTAGWNFKTCDPCTHAVELAMGHEEVEGNQCW